MAPKRKTVYIVLPFSKVPRYGTFRYKQDFTTKLNSEMAIDPKVKNSFLMIPLDFFVAMRYDEYERLTKSST